MTAVGWPASSLVGTADPVVRSALTSSLVIDGHNDMAWAARLFADYQVDGLDRTVPERRFQTDLPRMRRGGVGAQFWSVFVPQELKGSDAVLATLEQIDFVYRLVDRYPSDLAIARSAADVRLAWSSGRIASLLGAEGGHSINNSLAALRMMAQLGVSYMTLTHNDNTAWADSASDEPEHHGLTDFGREVVREMNSLGMLVDLSHVAVETMHHALDISSRPVMFSHSSCRAVADHPRNVPDVVLRRLRENRGIIMIAFVPMFLDERYAAWFAAGQHGQPPNVGIDHVVRHIEHAREVAGLAHIGLGSDFDGFTHFPAGLSDVSAFPRLLEALSQRGWTAGELAMLTGENMLRVLEEGGPAPALNAGLLVP